MALLRLDPRIAMALPFQDLVHFSCVWLQIKWVTLSRQCFLIAWRGFGLRCHRPLQLVDLEASLIASWDPQMAQQKCHVVSGTQIYISQAIVKSERL